MSSRQAEMFNKKAANPKFKADQIMETLELKNGQTIVDIGSGGGYFTYKFAMAVGEEGKVYAVDTNEEFLEFIKIEAVKQGLSNIITVISTSEHLNLPKHSFDYIFMRNMTHHLLNRVEYFKELKEILKSDGKVIIIEYNGRGTLSFHKIYGHFIPQKTIINEMKEAGYRKYKSYDFLSEQSFNIFHF